MTGIGHNGGPSLEPGRAWRAHCWRRARADLLPTLPVEVVRLRVRRAAEIGLDYRTYAGVRATTGHDLVAFLFSSNALGLRRAGDAPDPARVAQLAGLRAIDLTAAVHRPFDPARLTQALSQAGLRVTAGAAPTLSEGWPQTRARLRAILAQLGHPADRVLVIGETGLERDWAAAARFAGFVPADRYFGIAAQAGV